MIGILASEDSKRTSSILSSVGRYLSSVLITDDFEFIIIFCGWQRPTLGGGAFFIGMVINYYARQSGGKVRESKWARTMQEGRGKANRREKKNARTNSSYSKLDKNKHWPYFVPWLCNSRKYLGYTEESNLAIDRLNRTKRILRKEFVLSVLF